MNDWLKERLNFIGSLESYSPAIDPRIYKVTVKLDANENWHIPLGSLKRLVGESAEEVDVRLYPVRISQELLEGIAKQMGVSDDCIILTQSSDQGIDLLCQAFLDVGDVVDIVTPTFSFYRLRASLARSRYRNVDLNENLSLPIDKILRDSLNRILFICSPNNPTGNQFSVDDLTELIESYQGLVILDEAYADFAKYNLVKEVERYHNLVVIHTFSKSYGLAGLRLGYIAANPSLTKLLGSKVQHPYPISSLAAAVALKMIRQPNLIEGAMQSLMLERGWLIERLREIEGIVVFDSQTNFVLISLPVDSNLIRNALLDRGIAVRAIGNILNFKNCLRITVGTRDMNNAFLSAFREVLKN